MANNPAPRRAPHLLSNDGGNWVATTGAHSLFLVEAVLSDLDDDKKLPPSDKKTRKDMYREYAEIVLNEHPQPQDVHGQDVSSTSQPPASRSSPQPQDVQGQDVSSRSQPPATRSKSKSKRPHASSSKGSTSKPRGARTSKKKMSIEDASLDPKKKGITMGITFGQKERYSTGFAIARSTSGTYLKILTCAHIFEDLYMKDLHRLTVDDLNMMFDIYVICVHQEREVRARPSVLPPSRRVRQPTEASVIAIDTQKDLLVLQINTEEVCLFTGEESTEYCRLAHPPILVAPRTPQTVEEVHLLGWPPQRSESLSVGNVSFVDRTYDMICDVDFNVKGYTMELMEVDGLVCANGYSGGPCLNNNVQLTGTYHGVIEKKGYCVSLEDINQFLTQFQVMTNWPDEEENQEQGDDDDE